jgi:hypothetical protein
MLINLLSLIVVLGVLIFIHEGGHFLAARGLGASVPSSRSGSASACSASNGATPTTGSA